MFFVIFSSVTDSLFYLCWYSERLPPESCHFCVLSVGGCSLWLSGPDRLSRWSGRTSPHSARHIFHATTPAIVQCPHTEVHTTPEGHLMPEPQQGPQWDPRETAATWAINLWIAVTVRQWEKARQPPESVQRENTQWWVSLFISSPPQHQSREPQP